MLKRCAAFLFAALLLLPASARSAPPETPERRAPFYVISTYSPAMMSSPLIKHGLYAADGVELLPMTYDSIRLVSSATDPEGYSPYAVAGMIRSPGGNDIELDAIYDYAVYKSGGFVTEPVYRGVMWAHQNIVLCIKYDDNPPKALENRYDANFNALISPEGEELAEFYGSCFPLKNGVLGYDMLENRVLIFDGDGKLTAELKGFDAPDSYWLYEMDLTDTDDPLIPVLRDGKAGYINTAGDVVVPFQYAYTAGYSQGYALVSETSAYYDAKLIDTKGDIAFPLLESAGIFPWGSFRNGYAVVGRMALPSEKQADRADTKQALIDLSGRTITGWADFMSYTGYHDIIAVSSSIYGSTSDTPQQVWNKDGEVILVGNEDAWLRSAQGDRALKVHSINSDEPISKYHTTIVDATGKEIAVVEGGAYSRDNIPGYLIVDRSPSYELSLSDLLDLNGRPVITGLSYISMGDGFRFVVRKGFSMGLMDAKGQWVKKMSVFVTLDD